MVLNEELFKVVEQLESEEDEKEEKVVINKGGK